MTTQVGTRPAYSFVYDGYNVVQKQQSGAAIENELTGLNIDEVFQTTPTSGTASSMYTDGLGSVMALAGTGGTVATSYGYQPFGVTTVTNQASTNTFQYTSRENDGTGLYYNRARYYSPTWGRFISEDPIGYGGGVNFYAYTGNNPINFIDPTGNGPIGGAIGGIVGGDIGADLGGLGGGLLGGLLGGPVGAGVGGIGGADAGGLFGSKLGSALGSALEDALGDGSGATPASAPSPAAASGGGGGGGSCPPGALCMGDGSYGKGKMKNARQGGGDGQSPGNNQAQNKITGIIGNKVGLTPPQRDLLHTLVSGENYGYQQILDIANAIKTGTW